MMTRTDAENRLHCTADDNIADGQGHAINAHVPCLFIWEESRDVGGTMGEPGDAIIRSLARMRA